MWNENISESQHLPLCSFLPLMQHTRQTPGNFIHTCDLTWVESLLSSACDTVTTTSTTTEFQQNHHQHDSLASTTSTFSHYFSAPPCGSTMVLRAYELLSMSGLNAKGSQDSSTTLSRCYFSWPGMPLKGGCRVKVRRSKTKKYPCQWFSSHGTQKKIYPFTELPC